MSVWLIKIDLKDIFHDDDMPFEKKRDEIVNRLRSSGWLASATYPVRLEGALQELAKTVDETDFDFEWEMIYSHADRDRVWIGTF